MRAMSVRDLLALKRITPSADEDRYGPDHQPRELRPHGKGNVSYVTIGGLNEVEVFRTDDFSPVATIPVGNLSTRYLL
jgi:hypothetical protein